ncbi:hypothetical protein IJ847_01735 [Candidatus Saccharibacteria bacterium]|nr:hypothetical protein [Candidatus Saccharibacteria bacterium]
MSTIWQVTLAVLAFIGDLFIWELVYTAALFSLGILGETHKKARVRNALACVTHYMMVIGFPAMITVMILLFAFGFKIPFGR